MSIQIRLTLYDASGSVVETGVFEPEEAARRAAAFVLSHGADPEGEGADAQLGRIKFEPVRDGSPG